MKSEDTFFDVQLRPVWWEDEVFFEQRDPMMPCRGFSAVVDMESKRVLAVVKDGYALYLNRDAYELGVDLAAMLLEVDRKDVRLLSVRQKEGRGAVEYRFCSNIGYSQPYAGGGWIPCLTVVNSYDKTKTLECMVGFHNVEYGSVVSFPDFLVKAKSAHQGTRAEMEYGILRQFRKSRAEIRRFISDFNSFLDSLKRLPIADTDMLPLFCRIQGIRKKADLLRMQSVHLARALEFVTGRMAFYRTDKGHSAYTLLLVMADYVEHFNPEPVTMLADRQVELGRWVKEYSAAAAAEGYSPYEYIGKEAYDTASWFGMLR